jgi:2-polyprenyl-3-methyl-5-hydroxy-6-metoxy-1,4-benzoquinol methylase
MGGNELTSSDYWNEIWAKRKARRIPRCHYYYGENGIFIHAIKKQYPNIIGKRVLEIGGAGSHFLLALAKWCDVDATAIDYSAVGLRKTQEIFSVNDCNVHTVFADFITWNADDTKFDVVVHWGVLEHFNDPKIILKKCQQLLTPGGIVIFSMPNMVAYGARFWKKWAPQNWSRHIYHSDSIIEDACNSSGLKLISRFYWGIPMFRATRWEKNGILQLFVTGMQVGCNVLGILLPIYNNGSSKWAAQRGFLAKNR